MFDSLREKASSLGARIGAFYRANKGLVLGGITLFSILLIIWARMGFTFETSRFYAVGELCESDSDCGASETCQEVGNRGVMRCRATGGTTTTSTCNVGGTTCNGNTIFKHCTNKAGENGEDCAASGKICQNNNGSATVDGARCVTSGGAPAPAAEHFECRNSACVRVAGAGSNTGGCTAAGGACGGGATFPNAAVKPTPQQLRDYARTQGWSEDFVRFNDAVLQSWINCCWNIAGKKFDSKRGEPGLWEKPTECLPGRVPSGPDEDDPCMNLSSGGGGTPVPTSGGGTPAGTPLPAVLSVVCGATQNVLTWVTPLPTGSNTSAINKTTIPASGAQSAVQIGIDLGTNPSSYTDTNVVAGNRYTYVFKNHVNVRSNEVSCPQGSTTTDPNDPGAGNLKVVCAGGATPSITVRWSKSPPPGSTGELNAGNPAVLNRTVGTGAAEQLNPAAADKGTYWEWVDANVPSGATVAYRGKYGPNVGTNPNPMTFAATPAACGQAAALACAPLTQNVAVNQAAALQSSGAGTNEQVQWTSEGQTKNGSAATFVYSEQGTKTVTVRAGTQTATCTVVVGTGTTEALALVFTGRNMSTSGPQGTSVGAQPNQEVEFSAAIRNNTSGNLTGIMLQAGMPSTIAYVPGSTSVNGAATSVDSVAAGGLAVNSIGASGETVVRWRGRLSATGFPVGQTQAVVNATVTATGQSARSGQVTVLVNRTTGAGTPSTGPGEAVLAALLVSAVVTLLYVSYTHGPAYRRREVEGLGKERDPLDFRT